MKMDRWLANQKHSHLEEQKPLGQIYRKEPDHNSYLVLQWKFAGSLYFAFVSLALIGGQSLFQSFPILIKLVILGYGHSTPATKPGKMFTVAYCTLGIPLAMIMFQVMVV